MTEKHLGTFLRKIGLSIKNLEKIQDLRQDNNTTLTLFNDLKDIGILDSRKDPKTKKKTYSYYTVIPGFTVKEFISYQKKLKKDKNPRPFFLNSDK